MISIYYVYNLLLSPIVAMYVSTVNIIQTSLIPLRCLLSSNISTITCLLFFASGAIEPTRNLKLVFNRHLKQL